MTHQCGELFFPFNQRDLDRLDRREGVLIESYTRGPLEVHKENGEAVQTETYFAVRERDHDFPPHRNYIDLYVRGAKYFGLPARYITFLEDLLKQSKSD